MVLLYAIVGIFLGVAVSHSVHKFTNSGKYSSWKHIWSCPGTYLLVIGLGLFGTIIGLLLS